VIAYKILANWRLGRRYRNGDVETRYGSTHIGKTTAESLDYIATQFQDYLRYSGLREDELRGARILELGPGDNVGLALRFLAAGASRVVCVDKFSPTRDPDQERAIYRALRDSLPPRQRPAFREAISVEPGLRIDAAKLLCVYGAGLNDCAARLQRDEPPFDLVISRAVIEEIYDPGPALAAADALLAPGGQILHKIDLTDYGMFSDAGMHPLTFLTIPEWLYRRMASESGLPNRKRMSYYRDQVDALGYASKILVTGILGQGRLAPYKDPHELEDGDRRAALALVNAIRPKLSGEYRRMSGDELIVTGIFLVGRKPAAREISPGTRDPWRRGAA
jgi:hypothetical protein